MKHTPGPWIVNNEIKTAINAGDKHIAMVNYIKTPKYDLTGEEHEANVRLIVKAPEMLEAIIQAREACRINLSKYAFKDEQILLAAYDRLDEIIKEVD